MIYRPEVDGLRAVAVISVVLFHAGLKVFGGGYVGVDVFFVISGYLITTILINDLESNRFSLMNFYDRRMRRILPALIVVLVVCVPLAWILMLPWQLKDFGKGLAAVALFVSNVQFWREDSYFSEDADLKPLLHTWSLAVEEQYYLFFPIMLFILWRLGRRPAFWVVVAMAVISLALCEIAWRRWPSANFYLIPTRAWELFVGSICAFLLSRREINPNPWLSSIGLLAIVISVFWFDSATPFPSLYAVLPVAGAALVILYGGGATPARKILAYPAVVGIGLISYSAYLWHQPMFAFARILADVHPGPGVMLALAALAFGLAYLSWRFVEQPFRRGRGGVLASQKKVLLASAGLLVATVLVGAAMYRTPSYIEMTRPDLFRNYESTRKADARACADLPDSITKGVDCVVIGAGKSTIVVWGDSHTQALLTGVRPVDGMSVVFLSRNGCAPVPGVYRVGRNEDALACNKESTVAIMNYIRDLRPEALILVSRWSLYANGWYRYGKLQDEPHYLTDGRIPDRQVNADHSIKSLERGLHDLVEVMAKDLSVYFVKQPADLSMLGARSRLLNETVEYAVVQPWLESERTISDGLVQKGVLVIDSKQLFCSDQFCRLKMNGVPVYRDDNHLSEYGAEQQFDLIVERLRNDLEARRAALDVVTSRQPG